MIWLMVLLGGVVGAPSRFFVDRFVTRLHSSVLPIGTIVINVSGSAVLGVMTRLSIDAGSPRGLAYVAIGVGFCGAFTTFSTFAWETLALLEDGFVGQAIVNVLASLVLGIGVASAAYLLT